VFAALAGVEEFGALTVPGCAKCSIQDGGPIKPENRPVLHRQLVGTLPVNNKLAGRVAVDFPKPGGPGLGQVAQEAQADGLVDWIFTYSYHLAAFVEVKAPLQQDVMVDVPGEPAGHFELHLGFGLFAFHCCPFVVIPKQVVLGKGIVGGVRSATLAGSLPAPGLQERRAGFGPHTQGRPDAAV